MGLEEMVECIRKVNKGKVKEIIEERIREFEIAGKRSEEDIFSELCFCLLTANFKAEESIKIQKEIGSGFLKLSEEMLYKKLRMLSHRYPRARARYIIEARVYRNRLKKLLGSGDGIEIREWLVKNVKGLGYKEASHFLRNVGFKNLAIIDFHIVDFLVSHKVIERPKYLTKKKYLEIERILKNIGRRLGLDMARLDLLLWYMETGRVLK